MSNDDIKQAADAATGLIAFIGIAGIPRDEGRSYLRDELTPIFESFRESYSKVDKLTGSCRELIEHGIKPFESKAPRIVIDNVTRDCLERGLALFAAETQRMIQDAAE